MTPPPDPPPRPPIDPGSAVVAYCAPGLASYATTLLEYRRDIVREVIEHPWMAGRLDIILATDPDWIHQTAPDATP